MKKITIKNKKLKFALLALPVLASLGGNIYWVLARNTAQPVMPMDYSSVKSNVKLPELPPRASDKFAPPVKGRIYSFFGSSWNPNDGINIGAPLGTDISAAENGVVAYSGNDPKGMGNLVIIQHADGWMTVYAHLGKMSVKRGDKVNIGQKIGVIGQTDKEKVPQLRFEIRKNGMALNPLEYIDKSEIHNNTLAHIRVKNLARCLDKLALPIYEIGQSKKYSEMEGLLYCDCFASTFIDNYPKSKLNDYKNLKWTERFDIEKVTDKKAIKICGTLDKPSDKVKKPTE
jgi:hypothetical protein